MGDVADNLLAYVDKQLTVDATACVVYEGNVDADDLITTTTTPRYAGLDDVTIEAHFASAAGAGQTFVDPDGVRYIGRPAEATGEALHRIHQMSHDVVSREMGWPLVRHRVRDGRFEVLFEDIHDWRERLRVFTSGEIEVVLRKWQQTLDRYIALSEDICKENVREWLQQYIYLNAYMNLSFPLYAVCCGQLSKALADRALPEPYLSRVYHSVRPGTPLSWAERMNEDVARLSKGANTHDFDSFAVRYRLQSRFSLEFDAVPQIDWARQYIEAHQGGAFCPPLEEIFFPDDEEFGLVYDHYIAAKRMKESSHHIKFYGQWKANPFLDEQWVMDELYNL